MNKLFTTLILITIIFGIQGQNSAVFAQIGGGYEVRRGQKEAQEQIKNFRLEAREGLLGIRGAVREQLQKEREEFRKALEAKRQELRTTLQLKREELRARLQVIRDERKRELVEKIDQSIENLNNRLTTHYANVLDQIEKVLEKIISRTEKAKEGGRNVVAVEEAIVKAKAAIDKAREAVKAQAEKIYEISITTESNLKVDVGTARQQLHSDLIKVRDLVRAARESVREAATTLAQSYGFIRIKLSPQQATSVPSNKSTATVPSGTSALPTSQ